MRDSNPVVAHRILELKAETAKQDLITLRKAAMFGNPLVLFAAKLRGLLDGVRLARELLSGKADLPAGYASQIGEIKSHEVHHRPSRHPKPLSSLDNERPPGILGDDLILQLRHKFSNSFIMSIGLSNRPSSLLENDLNACFSGSIT